MTEIQEICEEFIRELSLNLADLRNQVQLTYWSKQHFITQELLDLLPFREILSDIHFWSYINYSLSELISKANSTLLYWRLSGVVQYDRTPIDQLSLFYNKTFLWHYCVPLYWTPTNFQFASPTPESRSTSSTCLCICGTDICYCDTRQPGTPLMPSYISLWNPKYSNQPINGLYYNQTLQTGTLAMISSSSRPPEIQFFPRYLPVRTF